MNTTKFRTLFPTILSQDGLNESLLDSILKNSLPQTKDYLISETDKEWTLSMPLPGVTKEEVTVSVKDPDILVIDIDSESIWVKNKSKKFTIPNSANSNEISGEVKEGVLTLLIPKKKSFQEKIIKIK